MENRYKGKTILIVAGGVLQVPAVRIAHDLGLRVVVTDRDPNCICASLADEFMLLDTGDAAGHVALAQGLKREGNLAAVFTEGADVELTVALAAASVGLPCVDPRAAYATKNKARMRELFDAAGLPGPRWAEVETGAQARVAAAKVAFPLVVKPVDNCASRGLTILTKRDPHLLLAAVERAKAFSTTGTALIEHFMEGPEQTVETLVHEHRHYPCFITDRLFTKKQEFAVECGLRSPTGLDVVAKGKLYNLVHWSAVALGIDFGAAKADTILTKDGPRILEMTCRLSGGYDCQYLVPAASGKEIIKAAMLLALGEGMHTELLEPKRDKHAVSYNPLPPPGLITSITGLEEARDSPGVEHVFMRYDVGEVIPPYQDCAARCCWIIAVDETHGGAWGNAMEASEKLHIETEKIESVKGRLE